MTSLDDRWANRYPGRLFVNAGMTMGWGDVLYGLEDDLMGTKEASEYASSQLEFGDDRGLVVDLAWPDVSLEEAKEKVKQLTGDQDEVACLLHRKRWQYALVLDAVAESSSYEQLSSKLDALYTRFDYDGDLRPLSQDVIFFEGDKASIITREHIGYCDVDKAEELFDRALDAYLMKARGELGMAPDSVVAASADGRRGGAGVEQCGKDVWRCK